MDKGSPLIVVSEAPPGNPGESQSVKRRKVSVGGDDDSCQSTLPLTLTATIYRYVDDTQGGGAERTIYVGQTVQSIEKRDAQHLCKHDTEFDSQYTKGRFRLEILEQEFFHAVQSHGNRKRMSDECQAWMDEHETHYIRHYDTFFNGLNSTRGGQGRGWLRCMLEWNVKMSHARFRDVYMPLIKVIVEDKGRDVNVPLCGYPDVEGSRAMGVLLMNIRLGHTTPQRDFMDYIQRHGFDLRRRDAEFERTWDENLECVRRVVEVGGCDVNVPRDGYPGVEGSQSLGRLFMNIRCGHTTPRQDFVEYIVQRGFVFGQNLVVHLARRHGVELKDMPHSACDLCHAWLDEFRRAQRVSVSRWRAALDGKASKRRSYGGKMLSDEEVRARYDADVKKRKVVEAF